MRISKQRILKILNSNSKKQTIKREKKGKKKRRANNISSNHKKKINLRRKTLKLLHKGGAGKPDISSHIKTLKDNLKKYNDQISKNDLRIQEQVDNPSQYSKRMISRLERTNSKIQSNIDSIKPQISNLENLENKLKKQQSTQKSKSKSKNKTPSKKLSTQRPTSAAEEPSNTTASEISTRGAAEIENPDFFDQLAQQGNQLTPEEEEEFGPELKELEEEIEREKDLSLETEMGKGEASDYLPKPDPLLSSRTEPTSIPTDINQNKEPILSLQELNRLKPSSLKPEQSGISPPEPPSPPPPYQPPSPPSPPPAYTGEIKPQSEADTDLPPSAKPDPQADQYNKPLTVSDQEPTSPQVPYASNDEVSDQVSTDPISEDDNNIPVALPISGEPVPAAEAEPVPAGEAEAVPAGEAEVVPAGEEADPSGKIDPVSTEDEKKSDQDDEININASIDSNKNFVTIKVAIPPNNNYTISGDPPEIQNIMESATLKIGNPSNNTPSAPPEEQSFIDADSEVVGIPEDEVISSESIKKENDNESLKSKNKPAEDEEEGGIEENSDDLSGKEGAEDPDPAEEDVEKEEPVPAKDETKDAAEEDVEKEEPVPAKDETKDAAEEDVEKEEPVPAKDETKDAAEEDVEKEEPVPAKDEMEKRAEEPDPAEEDVDTEGNANKKQEEEETGKEAEEPDPPEKAKLEEVDKQDGEDKNNAAKIKKVESEKPEDGEKDKKDNKDELVETGTERRQRSRIEKDLEGILEEAEVSENPPNPNTNTAIQKKDDKDTKKQSEKSTKRRSRKKKQGKKRRGEKQKKIKEKNDGTNVDRQEDDPELKAMKERLQGL
jgi:hypothetical protein